MPLEGFENIPGMTKRALRVIEVFAGGMKKYSGLQKTTRRSDNPKKWRNRVQSHEIEKGMYLTGSEVRAIVSHLRTRGVPIGSDGAGYFLALNPAEIEQTIKHMIGRARRIEECVRGLRKYQNEFDGAQTQLTLEKAQTRGSENAN